MELCRPFIIVVAVAGLFGTGAALSQDLFQQAPSANDLRRADGLIWDTSEDDAAPHWVFDGEFILACRGAPCISSSLGNVDFDLALTMVRPDGAESHSHNFTDFTATGISVVNDDLIVDGTIVFQGAAIQPILITIADVGDRATVSIELVGNTHIVGSVGGVTVRSR